MTPRNIVLGLALVMIALLAFLTLRVAIEEGVDILVVISLGILAMLGFGVIGALTTPPDE